jgi:cyclic pyranopterin phosphate synthase
VSDQPLTHFDESGHPRMVDVTEKAVTDRRAVAVGSIVMARETLQRVLDGTTTKGDPLQIARIAGIMAAKRVPELIPLCHQLPEARVDVELETDDTLPGIRARAEARVSGRTGVEMEALTAVSVALLTVYDMVKAVDRGMRIDGVRLWTKEGGRSGSWTAEPDSA